MKFMLLAVACCCTVMAQAQFQSGTRLPAGSFWLRHTQSKSDPVRINTLNGYLAPELGWAVRPNLVVGGRLNLGLLRARGKNLGRNYTIDGRTLGGSIFLRRYLALGKSFFISGDIDGGYSREQKDDESGLSTIITRTHRVALSLSPGLAYNATPRIQLATHLYSLATLGFYENSVRTDGAATEYARFIYGGWSGTGWHPSLTFRYLIPPRRRAAAGN